MPAEWERQEAVWLAWPHNKEDWPGKFALIPWAYGEIVRCLARHVRVRLIVKNERAREEAASLLAKAGADAAQVDFMIAATDRVWLRDSGATVVYDDGARVLIDWRFNGWAKYGNCKRDDKIPRRMEEFLNLPRIQPKVRIGGKLVRLVLEGGAFDVNGKGTVLVTEECLLGEVQCRNPGLSREEYEKAFAQYLGATQTIWLGKGIVGDDTHGHVDDIARFVNPATVVAAVERNAEDSNYEPLQANLKILKVARDQDGAELNIIELPMPAPVMFEGERLPASYANFVIANGLVLVPLFNDPQDRVALNILTDAFPNREIIGIYCRDLVLGLGTLHCMSQQEPAQIL